MNKIFNIKKITGLVAAAALVAGLFMPAATLNSAVKAETAENVIKTVTFDDMPDNLMSNSDNRYVTAGCFSIADGNGQNGTKALKYTGSLANQEKKQSLNDGERTFNVDSSTYYKVTLRYYRESGTSEAKVRFGIPNSPTNYFDVFEQQGDLKTLDTALGEWKEATFAFKPSKSGALVLAVDGKTDQIIYFDNIAVEAINRVTVNFEAGDADVMPIKGAPGTEVNLPGAEAVVVAGQEFKGWYSDAALTQPVTSPYALPTDSSSVTLYAKMETAAGALAEFNFDSGDYANFKTNADVDGKKVSGGMFAVDNSAEGGTGKALKIAAVRNLYNGDSRTSAFNNGSVWFTLEPGTYKISYRYMLTRRNSAEFTNYNSYSSKDPELKFVTFTKAEHGWMAGSDYTNISSNLFDLKKTTTDDSWHSAEQEITVSGTEAVCFGVRAGYVYFDVYLDDIVIEKPAAKQVTVTFETNGGSAVAPTTGDVGTVLTVENPTKDGFKFDGWYTDTACTVPATMVYPQNDAVFYAKWIDDSSIKITFDDDFKTGTISAGLTGGGMFNMAAAPDNASNKTLAVAGDRTSYDGNTRALKFNDGTKFMTLDAGDHVEITYKYYIKDRQGDSTNTKGDFAKYTDSNNNPEIYFLENMSGTTAGGITGDKAKENGKSAVQLVNVKTDKANKWHTNTIVVDITKTGVVGITATRVWADVYFDDFEFKITKQKQVTVTFDSCGGSACGSLTLNAGSNFTLPTPTREGYNFAGWFTEPDGQGTRATSVVPQEDITYYAKWISENTVFIDFENGLKPGSVDVVGSGFFKSGDGDADHGKVMIYQPTNDLPRPRMLTEEAKVLPDTDYIISFDYNIRSLPKSASFEFDFATALGTGTAQGERAYEKCTRITNKNLLTDATPSNTSVVGKWRRVTLVIHTPKDVGTGYLAAFGTVGNGAVIWFDNMEIRRVNESSNPMLFIDYGYDGITEIKEGTAGTVYPLGTPSREGYDFDGWVDEKGNEITSVTYPAYGVIYAYAKWFNSTPKVVTFDDMPDNHKSNSGGRFVTAACFSFAGGKGQNGTKALKYSGASGSKKQALNDGNNNFTLKKGTTYMVKLRYYRESGIGAVSIRLGTANANNFFDGYVVQSSAVRLSSEKGSWQEAVIFFEAKNSGALFLDVDGNTSTTMYFDNIEFRELSKKDVVLTFASETTGESWYLVGRSGTSINAADIPVINVKYYPFAGWFMDSKFTAPFKAKVFPSESMTVYAKLSPANPYVIDFTDYPYEGDTSHSKISSSVMSISRGGPSSDGDGCALLFDNTTEKQTTEQKKLLLGAGYLAMPLQSGVSYLISYDYYVEKSVKGGNFTVNFASSDPGNMFANFKNFEGTAQNFKFDTKDAKTWYRSSMVVTVPESKNVMGLAGALKVALDAKIYIDNITVTTIEDGYSALVYASSMGNPPAAKVVKNGTTVKLAKMSNVGNFRFLGWYYGAEDTLITENSILVDKSIQLRAEFTVNHFTEGFEDTAYAYDFGEKGYESGWEIYDAKASGNNAGNAHGGRYSLHRIGDDPSFRAYSIHSNQTMSAYTLSAPVAYTVSMWVKVENPVHKLGAIEIMNSTKAVVPWSYEGERYAIAAIADIADGEWHKVSFTFNSVTHYLSIVTPGNLSIYIDDITIEYAGDKSTDSSVNYQEYIPCFLNSDGTYPTDSALSLTAYEVVDGIGPLPNSEATGFTGTTLFVVIIICGVVVLVSAGGAAASIIIFKKKGGK